MLVLMKMLLKKVYCLVIWVNLFITSSSPSCLLVWLVRWPTGLWTHPLDHQWWHHYVRCGCRAAPRTRRCSCPCASSCWGPSVAESRLQMGPCSYPAPRSCSRAAWRCCALTGCRRWGCGSGPGRGQSSTPGRGGSGKEGRSRGWSDLSLENLLFLPDRA